MDNNKDDDDSDISFNFDKLQEEVSLVVLKKSRRSFERHDSVCDNILTERKNHVKRLIKVQAAIDPDALINGINLWNNKLSGGPTLSQLQQHKEDAKNLNDSQKRLLENIPNGYINFLENLGFSGKNHKSKLQNTYLFKSKGFKVSSTGAEGIGVAVGTAQRNWPIFKHLLPEICFAGHSNCGKSSLVNALTGLGARKGPASVSDRAGWTNQISFFQLGRVPPKLTVVDLPGYGFAVATMEQKRHWKMMTSDYLQSRDILSCCCVLVDCTRGICNEDKILLRRIKKLNIDWRIILTKCDILSTDMLLNSILVVLEDLHEMGMFVRGNDSKDKKRRGSDNCSQEKTDDSENTKLLNGVKVQDMFSKVIPVSSATGAGIQHLWEELNKCAMKSSKPVLSADGQVNPRAVREHVRASFLRKKEFLEAKFKLIKQQSAKGGGKNQRR